MIVITVAMLLLQPLVATAAWTIALATNSADTEFLLTLQDSICGHPDLDRGEPGAASQDSDRADGLWVCDWCPCFGGPPGLPAAEGVVLARGGFGSSATPRPKSALLPDRANFAPFLSRAPPAFAIAPS